MPKEWREKYAKKGKAILKVGNDTIVIKSYELIEVDTKSGLSDWKSVRRELLEVR